MKRLFILVITIYYSLFTVNYSLAQGKYNNNWVTGGTFNHIINFDSAIARTFILDTTLALGFSGSHSCINDSLGNLLLMCSGSKVYNNQKAIIENGDTLINKKHYLFYNGNGSVYTAQGSIIILPFDSQIYKVFTVTYTDSMFGNGTGIILPNEIYMHTIDMKLNNGLGKVIEKKKTISKNKLLGLTGMTACRHANGVDWWLTKQAADTNIIYSFFISKDSISDPIENSFSTPAYTYFDRSGQMAFNQQGTKIANVQEQPNQLFVADFDRCYGIISNPKVFNLPLVKIDSSSTDTTKERLPSGVCFSPNGQFIYVIMRSKIFQLDLNEPDSTLAWYYVATFDTNLSYFQLYSNAQIGPDNKIYIGNWNGLGNTWNIIENPDIKGMGCNYCKRCLRFKKTSTFSPPNCINFNLGAISPPCAPLSNKIIASTNLGLSIYPNPVHNSLNIKLANNYNGMVLIKIEDALGKTIIETQINIVQGIGQVNVSRLVNGVYSIKVAVDGNGEVVKFLKE
jgi:hypothetical protein